MPNLAALLLGLYAAYYIILEWFAGLTWTAFVALPVFVTANALQQVLRASAPLLLDIGAGLPCTPSLVQNLLHMHCLLQYCLLCSHANGLQPCIART